MNITLREVYQTSTDADQFWKLKECYVRGSTIKYLRVPDTLFDAVKGEASVCTRGRSEFESARRIYLQKAIGVSSNVIVARVPGFPYPRFSPAQLRELRSQEDPPVFRAWSTIPEVVTVILVAPHRAITKVQSDLSAAATPTLECRIHANLKLNSFDGAGISGLLPMIVSFPALSTVLVRTSSGTVGLAIRPNMGVWTIGAKIRARDAPTTSNDMISSENSLVPLKLDAKCSTGQASLASGCAVTVEQLSPNRVKLHVDQYKHVISFPLPVDTANAKLRIARKSKYVEVAAPMTLTLTVKGQSDTSGSFRTAINCGVLTIWTLRDRTSAPCFQRECKSCTQRAFLAPRTFPGTTMYDTFMDLKDSLRAFLSLPPDWKGRLKPEKCYATILVTDIRLDLGSHAVVADSWIIPWTKDIQYKVKIERILPIKTGAHKSEAWRHLVPLFIERCRTWKHKPSCEYLVHKSAPLYPGAGSDSKKVPWCSCEMGIETEVLKEHYGSVSAKYATRAAISPFSIPSRIWRR
ncbi:hypothetical protein EDD16DRAFT_1732443 [Pisolithus croceorrhizus]|nr:hypothetical protein EDD16DRAFT_1732443 [Pisolithus croceorrhizus]